LKNRVKISRAHNTRTSIALDFTFGVARQLTSTSLAPCRWSYQCVGASNPCRAARWVVTYVRVPHGVEFDGEELFYHIHLHGGPASVRRFLPDLIDLVRTGRLKPARSSI